MFDLVNEYQSLGRLTFVEYKDIEIKLIKYLEVIHGGFDFVFMVAVSSLSSVNISRHVQQVI